MLVKQGVPSVRNGNKTSAVSTDDLDKTQLLKVLTALKNGDFTPRLPIDKEGVTGKIYDAVNDIIEMNERTIQEFKRAEIEIGTRGKFNERLEVPKGKGRWTAGLNSLNSLISDLVHPTIEIASVISSVANGNLLNKKMPLDIGGKPLRGEFLKTAKEVNNMVKQLNLFSMEVTRVAREVGTDGKLGAQAKVKGVGGVWKDLTDSVNQMANNLTGQVRNIAEVAIAVADGDLSKKITMDVRGEMLQLKETINTMVDQLRAFAAEVTRVAKEVGTDGNPGGQAFVPGVAGTWKELIDSVNRMSSNLTAQVRNISQVTKAVASGDLSKKVMIDVKGEILDLKNTINTMVDQLSSFACEVTRIAREVGTEGKLGGQADVKGVGGTWKDLTDNVNLMASNLTVHVRSIAQVVTGVANGKLKQKLNISAPGEVAQLFDTINDLIDTLAVFAEQVTTVAREVGVEGKLGGQASVPGASGIWKDLTENVNKLAHNLTTQVRAISDVASAVTQGDLTRMINGDSRGEIEALKDTINQMIANLKETTIRNQEQNWLKSNLAKFTQMLQGQKDLKTVTDRILSELVHVVDANAGAFYILQHDEELPDRNLQLFSAYALARSADNVQSSFEIGEGLVGQCALQKERISLTQVPDGYIKIKSGLGQHKPLNIIILPVIFENNIKAVIELASFNQFNEIQMDFLGQLTESIGIVLNTIETNTRTEVLLSQSQSLAAELKSQQEELRRANDELQDKALLLVEQKEEVEKTNKEVEEARKSLEEKAEQLAMASKYKSEFLANMSHELRTPLNSLLILAQQLYENRDGNLSDKQVKFARTIYSCGDDLIQLINDILDLSKIESGVISTNILPVSFHELSNYVETTFKPISETKGLKFNIEIDKELPEAMETDSQRLKQILKNLLSNSFKFTEKGEISLKIFKIAENDLPSDVHLQTSDPIVAFQISDTGIGIPGEKQQIIFEAFQQAEGSTSRKYGGTGLGLSISKGLAELLGGSIRLNSEPGKGSSFILYLPLKYFSSEPDDKMINVWVKYSGRQTTDAAYPESNFHHDSDLIDIVRDIINEIDDDRNNIGLQDKVLLVIEDDRRFAKIIYEKAHEAGLKTIIASRYNEIFHLAGKYKPIGITLDVNLPDTNGWKVLELIKNDLNLRHIPLHVISGEENKELALSRGAKSFQMKPVTLDELSELLNEIREYADKEEKHLLLIEDNELESNQILNALKVLNVSVTVVNSGKTAADLLANRKYDCIIYDYRTSGIIGMEMLVKISQKKPKLCPIIIYSDKSLNEKELKQIGKYSGSILIKGIDSFEHLLESIITNLHINHQNLNREFQDMIEKTHRMEDILKGKKVLIVDDDVRNLFALTSALERVDIVAYTAESGMEAIEIVKNTGKIDMILMDIMMPEMDGNETIKKIRQDCGKEDIPIIAVTARAMKGDRDKSLNAGASDYVTKPVNLDNLLSLMRIWMYQ